MTTDGPLQPISRLRRRVRDCPHRGRGLDASRDPQIMRAALELLAEHGYDRLTMEAVAARAHAGKATLYRRWCSKAELVVDAVACFDGPAQPPVDTGSLREDLRTVFLGRLAGLDDLRVGVMAGLVTALRRNPDLAKVFDERFLADKVSVLAGIFERAKQRGEVADGHDVELLATIGPAILFHRLLLTGKPLSPQYVGRVIDEVILPLAAAEPSRRKATR